VPRAAEAVERISKTRLSLGLTELRRLFPSGSAVQTESVARGKPHPDLFRHASAVIEVKPARRTVVEDTLSGITAAVSAALYVADSDEIALRHAGVEMNLRSLDALPACLGLAKSVVACSAVQVNGEWINVHVGRRGRILLPRSLRLLGKRIKRRCRSPWIALHTRT
jgi:hypothetical protein